MSSQRLYLKARALVPARNGLLAFVRARDFHFSGKLREARDRARRERSALKTLAGLAVPRPAEVSARELKRVLGCIPRHRVACEFIPGKSLDRTELKFFELAGVWLFVIEQLAAFRKRGILYTDVSGANIIVSRRPLRAVIVELNGAIPLARRGKVYPRASVSYTVGFEAPEHVSRSRLAESALVFQAGLLLGHCWSGMYNGSLENRRSGIAGLCLELRKSGSGALAGVVSACLARSPGERPRDYEDLLGRIRALGRDAIAPATLRVWERLRTPYIKSGTMDQWTSQRATRRSFGTSRT